MKKKTIDHELYLAITNKTFTPKLLQYCLKKKVITAEEKEYLEWAKEKMYFGSGQYEKFTDLKQKVFSVVLK